MNAILVTNKQIKAIDLNDNRLLFTFADDTKMKLSDNGHQCCEDRYLHSDDDLSYFVGSRLTGIEMREVEIKASNRYEYTVAHDVQFLVISTDKGVFTVEAHNEHNGYYEGFEIRVKVIECHNESERA